MARAAVVLAVAAALLAAAAHPARAGTDVCDATGSREGGDSLITSTEKNHWFGEVSQGIGTYWESDRQRSAPKCIFADHFFPDNEAILEEKTVLGGPGGQEMLVKEALAVRVGHDKAITNKKWVDTDVKRRLSQKVTSVLSTAKDTGGNCIHDTLPGSLAMGDYNSDGNIDMFVPRYHSLPLLYRNNGDGTFTDVAEDSGLYFAEGKHKGDEPLRLSDYTSGAAFFDADNDGDEDLYVSTMGLDRHLLFINTDGEGTFREEGRARNARVVLDSDTSMTSSGTVAVGDYDNDGWLDLYVTEWRMASVRDVDNWHGGYYTNSRLLHNRGAEGPEFAGHFEDATDKAGVNVELVARKYLAENWATRNLVLAEEKTTKEFRKGEKKRERELSEKGMAPGLPAAKSGIASVRHKRSVSAGVYTFGTHFVDLDNDGFKDLYLGSDFDSTILYWNNGDGTFSEDTRGAGMGLEQNGMGTAIMDVDRDGLLDVYITAIYSPRPIDLATAFGVRGNVFYRNKGGRKFEENTRELGLRGDHWSWGAAFFDFDNDGDLDAYVGNGMTIVESTGDDEFNVTPNEFFINPMVESDGSEGVAYGEDVFTEDGEALGVNDRNMVRGLGIADYDNDGDLDMFTAPNGGHKARVFRNDGANFMRNNWLRVDVREDASKGHRPAIGAHVYIAPSSRGAGHDPATGDDIHMSYIGDKNQLQTQSEGLAHFGLGMYGEEETYTVKVVFFAPPAERVIHNVRPNQVLRIERGGSPDTDAKDEAACDETVVHKLKPLKDVPINEAFNEDEQWEPPAKPRVMPEGGAPEWARRWTHRVTREKGVIQRLIDDVDEYAFDGSGNNKAHPRWGAALTPLVRDGPVAYADGVALPRGEQAPPGKELPSARNVSNTLMTQSGDVPDGRGLTDLAVHFGQLLAHDTDHTTPQLNTLTTSYFPIPVPSGDPYFDPEGTGEVVIRFRRSIFDPNSGFDKETPLEQINKVTSFVDASSLYGSDGGRADALRERKGGLLATLVDDYAPALNPRGIANDNPLAYGIGDLVAAGDARANIQPGLLAMHTLFVREHNLIAKAVRAECPAGVVKNFEDNFIEVGHERLDDILFSLTRRILIAEFQAVTYNEYLPALLGPDAIPPYTGYNPELDPSVATEFSTAGFRVGHSQANNDFDLVFYDGSTKPAMLLNESYFKTRETLQSDEGGLDPVMRGMIGRLAQASDLKAVDGLRNFLFGPIGAGGVDLMATNIQRGRDHGVADYNTVRGAYGLGRRNSFAEVTDDAEVAKALEELYPGGIDTLDLFVGGLAEPRKAKSSLGETLHKIVTDGFIRLRDGDRLWYENTEQGVFTPAEVAAINRATTMGSLLRRNVAFKPGTPQFDALRTNVFIKGDVNRNE